MGYGMAGVFAVLVVIGLAIKALVSLFPEHARSDADADEGADVRNQRSTT